MHSSSLTEQHAAAATERSHHPATCEIAALMLFDNM